MNFSVSVIQGIRVFFFSLRFDAIRKSGIEHSSSKWRTMLAGTIHRRSGYIQGQHSWAGLLAYAASFALFSRHTNSRALQV